MPNLILTIGQFKITPLYWGFLIAFVFSSFSMWKKMVKEDYLDEEIFSINILMLLAGIGAEKLFISLFGIKIIGALIGSLTVFAWRIKTLEKDIWEGLDFTVLPMIYFFLFGSIGRFLSVWRYEVLSYWAVALIGLFVYLYLSKNYRRFSWYMSGKVGFLFWANLLFFSFSLLVIDFWQKKGLYWSEVLWLAVVTISAFIIYKRAEIKKK